jgi:hypothetical protein
MSVCLGTVFAMQQRIVAKLRERNAISKGKAVTAQEAHLDVQEQNWLNYVAGGFASVVKKTKDKRYYLMV